MQICLREGTIIIEEKIIIIITETSVSLITVRITTVKIRIIPGLPRREKKINNG